MKATPFLSAISLLLLVGMAPLRAADSVQGWTTAPGKLKLARAENGAVKLTYPDIREEFSIESTQSLPAKTGDGFAIKVRIRAGIETRALPELVSYDAAGNEIPVPSPIEHGNPYVTTEWQTIERVFVAQPGATRVRARVRGSGAGSILVAGLEFEPRTLDPYATGALITQLHPSRRSNVVLESNFSILNRELISRDDRDGDGKWALITVDLDALTAPAKKGEDWRSGFEDNPNVILWSDGAVLKSDTVHADRAPDAAKALHYRTKIHPGPYLGRLSDPGRAVAVSLDGKTWKRYAGGEEIELGTLPAKDGVIELWLDACYRDAASVGPVYFDYVRLTPKVDAPSIERLLAKAKQKPPQITRGSAEERRVPVTLNVSAVPRGGELPVRCGLPIPQGELVSADHVAVLDPSGKPIRSQSRIMATWPDGSARWILTEFMARALEGYAVVYGNRVRTPPAGGGVHIERTARGLEIDTGALRFAISGERFGFMENVRLASGQVVQAAPIASEIVEAGGRVWRAGDLRVAKLEVEQAGPLHAVIRVETKLAESGQPAEGFYHRARIHAYADSPLVEIDYFVANTDSRPAGKVGGSMSSKIPVKSFSLKLTPTQPIAAAHHALGAAGANGAIAQKSELDAIVRDAEATRTLRERVPGWLALGEAGGAGLQVGVADFREQFPKALRWSPREVAIDLWSEEGGVFDWIEGVGKTHHVAVNYQPTDAAGAAVLAQGPVLGLAAPEWYVQSGALGRIEGASDTVLPQVERSLARHINDSVVGRMGLGFENYGDHSSGGYVKGTFLWDNNEYDLPAGALVHFARTGDRAALRAGLAGALHYVDVDVCHYSSKHSEWARAEHTHSHGVVGHHTAQGPDMQHAGYVQGLIWYTYITGDPAGLEGARGIAEWILKKLNIHTNTMERALGHPLMTLNDLYEATGEERYLRGCALLADQAVKWENPLRSGLPYPITESPAYYSGCPFNAGMTFSALMKFNTWAHEPELDGTLERLAQWVLTDVWRPPGVLQGKGGSPRRHSNANYIANHGRLMAWAYERTKDPLYLVVSEELTAAGFAPDAKGFGTRDTGLVFNYLPWLLAELRQQGNPTPEAGLEITATVQSPTVAVGARTEVRVTLKNTGSAPVEHLRASLRGRLDLETAVRQAPPERLLPGQSAESVYELDAPPQLDLTCEYNRIAYLHWSALYRRGSQAHLAHQPIKIVFVDNLSSSRAASE